MRIAQILPELNVGGVETGTVDLAKALKRRGDEPYVISNGGTLVAELIKSGIPHVSLPVHQKSVMSLALVKTITSFLERERIDIIHARSRVPAWLAYLAARRTNCDFVTTCHGYYSKHFLSRVMGWGKRVIVISHSIGRRMIDDFEVPPERVTLIHRGVDLGLYPFAPDKYDRPQKGNFKIINIGRITPIKGHEEFIRAVHLLSRRVSNVEAWIVGAPDSGKEGYFRGLKLMVSRLGLESQIKFLGTRRDVPELVREADLLVLSSKIPEAFGRVLIEAGAVGTAVAASRIGGILDVVDHEKTGLLFSPEDEEEMAQTMERLLLNRTASKTFACALRRKVEQEFTLDQMVEKTCRVYQEVRREKRILIAKLGALGDLVLAVPSFRMIRKRFPEAHLTLLADSRLIPLMERSPYLDELICFNRQDRRMPWRQILSISKKLRSASFDMSIDFQNNWQTHWLAFLARIPMRYGYRRGGTGYLLTHPVLSWDRQLAPVEHQFQVLKRAGVIHYDDQMELWTEPDQDAYFVRLFGKTSGFPPKPCVGFVLGASPKWATKQWPLEYFLKLAGRLVRELDCRVVLLGTQEDEPLARAFRDINSGSIIDITGKTTLAQLPSSVKQLDVIVTGDTAPLHIASAVGTKIVALFGPTEPKRHMPPGVDHVVLVKRIPCQPCYRGTCANQEKLKCLRSITVDEVFEAVKEQLDR